MFYFKLIRIVLPLMLLIASLNRSQAQRLHVEGFLAPYKSIQLAAPEPGIIDKIHVVEGQTVKAKELVVTLNRAVLQASLNAANVKANSKGALDSAQANYDQKLRRLDGIVKLLQSGSASPEELQRAKSEEAIAKANLVAAKEQVEAAKFEAKRIESQLEHRNIRSSIDGVVIRLNKDEGEFVTSTEPIVATIVDLEKLKVTFYLPTSIILNLKQGDLLQVSIDKSTKHTDAKIEFISPVTDSDSETVRVVAIVDNRRGIYRSGLRCTIQDKSIRDAVSRIGSKNFPTQERVKR